MDNERLTYLQRFLQYYPNANLNGDGTPYSVCRNAIIGQWGKTGCNFGKSCKECWNEVENEPNDNKKP